MTKHRHSFPFTGTHANCECGFTFQQFLDQLNRKDTPCPEGDGGLDCTPFCPTCEGKQFVKVEEN